MLPGNRLIDWWSDRAWPLGKSKRSACRVAADREWKAGVVTQFNSSSENQPSSDSTWAQEPPPPPSVESPIPQYPPRPPAAYPSAGYDGYGAGASAGARTGAPARLGARAGARIVDGFIVGIPLGIIGAALGSPPWFSLLQIAAFLGYAGYLTGVKEQTIGKKLLGITVVDVATGRPIGFGRAVLRDIVLTATAMLCFLGYLSPLFDGTKRNRGWHDKAAKDLVLSTR
jgi:uncharacterized RDD family membrane protein YckC